MISLQQKIDILNLIEDFSRHESNARSYREQLFWITNKKAINLVEFALEKEVDKVGKSSNALIEYLDNITDLTK